MVEMKRSHFQQVNRQRKLKKWGFGITAILLGVGFLCAIFFHFQAQNAAQQRFFQHYPVRGISIDQNDDYVDFIDFKRRGGEFVYLRSSQGSDYLDDDFSDNYARSIGSGLKIGVYHQYGFATSIKGQEKNFSRAVNGQIGQLPIRLDIDYYGKYNAQTVNRKQLYQRVNQLVDYLYQRYDRPVLIKTNQTNYQTLKKLPHTQFMLSKNQSGQKVTFNKLNAHDPFYQDGKSSPDNMAAYHGNKVQWKQYLQRME